MRLLDRFRAFVCGARKQVPEQAQPVAAAISNGPNAVVLDVGILEAELEALQAKVRIIDAPEEAARLVSSAANRLLKYTGPAAPRLVEIVVDVAELASSLGLSPLSVPLLNRASAAEEKVYAAADPRRIPMLTSIGLLRSDIGDLEAAKNNLRRALALSDRQCPPTRDTLRILQGLAIVLQHEHQFEESCRVSERLIAAAEQIDGPQSTVSLEARDAFARTLLQRGLANEALGVARRTQQFREECWGDSHPDTAEGLDVLAMALKHTGEVDQALQLQTRAAEIFGADNDIHPAAGRSLGNLAGTLMGLGRKEEALPLLQRALAAKEASLGPHHPSIAHTLSNLALLAAEKQAFRIAEPLMNRAHKILTTRLGANHLETLRMGQLLNRIATDLGLQDALLAKEDNVREIDAEFLASRQR